MLPLDHNPVLPMKEKTNYVNLFKSNEVNVSKHIFNLVMSRNYNGDIELFKSVLARKNQGKKTVVYDNIKDYHKEFYSNSEWWINANEDERSAILRRLSHVMAKESVQKNNIKQYERENNVVTPAVEPEIPVDNNYTGLEQMFNSNSDTNEIVDQFRLLADQGWTTIKYKDVWEVSK